MPILIDDSRAPLLYFIYEGKIRDEDLENVVRAVKAWSARRTAFGIVVDTLKSDPLTAAQRKRLADAITETSGSLRACSVVIGSAAMRGVMTALQWISRPSFSLEVVATREEAERYVRGMLEREAKSRA